MPACKDQGYYFQHPAMEGRQGGRRGRLVTKFATREWSMGGLGCWHVVDTAKHLVHRRRVKFLERDIFLLFWSFQSICSPMPPKGCDSVVNFVVVWWQKSVDVIGDKQWFQTISSSRQKFFLYKVNWSRGNIYCAIYSFIHSQLTGQWPALLPGFWVTVSIATKQASPWSRHNNLLLK